MDGDTPITIDTNKIAKIFLSQHNKLALNPTACFNHFRRLMAAKKQANQASHGVVTKQLRETITRSRADIY